VRFSHIFLEVLGILATETQPDLLHDVFTEWMDSFRLKPGTVGFKFISPVFSKKGLGQLTASGIARAKK
jgi:hypothetical protein